MAVLYDDLVVNDAGQIVVESFEDADMSEYTNGGGDHEITDNFAAHGSLGLENDGVGGTFTLSTAGLPAYPKRGNAFTYWLTGSEDGGTVDQTMFAALAFGVDPNTHGNHYEIRTWWDEQFVLVRFDDWAYNQLDWTSLAGVLSANEAYEVNVKWDDGDVFGGAEGDIDVRLYDDAGVEQASLFDNDATYDFENVGWHTEVQSPSWRVNLDYLHLGRDMNVTPVIDPPEHFVTVAERVGIVDAVAPTVEAGILTDSFENYSTGAAPPNWTVVNGTVTDAVGGTDGTQAFNNDYDAGSSPDEYISSTDPDGAQPDTITYAYRETSSSGGHAYVVEDTNGNYILKAGTHNPQARVESGSGTTTMEGSPSPSYEAWRRYTITMDWVNETFDVLWEDIDGSSADATATDLPFITTGGGGVGRVWCGNALFTSGGTGVEGAEWNDELWGVSSIDP